MRRVTCICKANSMLLFLHTDCKNKGHVLFFFSVAFFIVISTEVNIFPWYFVSKLLILQDLFYFILFFSQEPEQPKHMQIHRLCSIVLLHTTDVRRMFVFSFPSLQPRWLL